MRGAPYIASWADQKWHLSTGSFDGTDEYGDINNPENHFSIKFDTNLFDQV